jgi:hypothetical protein
MGAPPTRGWDVVFGSTVDLLQEMCNDNFAKNDQLNTAVSVPPTISLNGSNQIVFRCLPVNYPGAYDVALDLASVTVTPVPGDTGALLDTYQMCFGAAPFSVSAATGGDDASATSIGNRLNGSVSNQCLPFETRVRRGEEGIELEPQVQALLEALSPQFLAFASLVDSSGAPVGQLLTPFVSASPTPPSGDAFAAFAGDEALGIEANSAGSNALYALWDYFLLNNLVKPKLATSFGVDESVITVSADEPAVLAVDAPLKLKDGVTLTNLTMKIASQGMALSMTVAVEKDAEIFGIPLSTTMHGDLSVTAAQTVDSSTDPPTVGFTIVSTEASFDQEEVAKFVALGVMEQVFEAFSPVDRSNPSYYIVAVLALIVFLLVWAVLLLILAIAADNQDEVLEKVQEKLNEKLDENRRAMDGATTLDEVAYNLGTISFLTITPAQADTS